MKRRLGALLAAGVLLLTFAGTTLASTSSVFDWKTDGNGQGWPNETCTAGSVSMLWVWTGGTPTSLTINGQLQSGSWVEMNDNGKAAWHFTTDINGTNYPPTSASITYTGTVGILTLSHCDGTTTTTTSSTTASSTTSSETSSTTSGTTTQSTTTSSSTTTQSETTTETTSTTVQSETTTDSTTDGSTTTADTTTSGTTTSGTTTSGTTTSSTTTTTSSPSGSVLGETGSPTITPPSTDALGTPARSTSGAWSLVLILGVALSLSILVLTPMAKSRRRR